MDVLLGFPSHVLERTPLSVLTFCQPITSQKLQAGELVWLSHPRGLGMPRHRKTRLLHWPAYRLLFLIRVLDWNGKADRLPHLQNAGERACHFIIIFFIYKTFYSHQLLISCDFKKGFDSPKQVAQAPKSEKKEAKSDYLSFSWSYVLNRSIFANTRTSVNSQ